MKNIMFYLIVVIAIGTDVLAEQNWLINTFCGVNKYWIGFTDKDIEGIWQSISGEPVTFTSWYGPYWYNQEPISRKFV